MRAASKTKVAGGFCRSECAYKRTPCPHWAGEENGRGIGGWMQRIGSQFGASGVQTSQRCGRVFLTRCSTIVESRLQHPFFDASVSNGIVSFIHHTVAFPMSIARLLHCSFWNLRSLVAPAIRSEKPLALGSDDRLGSDGLHKFISNNTSPTLHLLPSVVLGI